MCVRVGGPTLQVLEILVVGEGRGVGVVVVELSKLKKQTYGF